MYAWLWIVSFEPPVPNFRLTRIEQTTPVVGIKALVQLFTGFHCSSSGIMIVIFFVWQIANGQALQLGFGLDFRPAKNLGNGEEVDGCLVISFDRGWKTGSRICSLWFERSEQVFEFVIGETFENGLDALDFGGWQKFLRRLWCCRRWRFGPLAQERPATVGELSIAKSVMVDVIVSFVAAIAILLRIRICLDMRPDLIHQALPFAPESAEHDQKAVLSLRWSRWGISPGSHILTLSVEVLDLFWRQLLALIDFQQLRFLIFLDSLVFQSNRRQIFKSVSLLLTLQHGDLGLRSSFDFTEFFSFSLLFGRAARVFDLTSLGNTESTIRFVPWPTPSV